MNKPTEAWEHESFTLSSEETFQMPEHQVLFDSCTLSHNLYYHSTEESFFPFEILWKKQTVALGYMIEDKQHILLLVHDNRAIINKI